MTDLNDDDHDHDEQEFKTSKQHSTVAMPAPGSGIMTGGLLSESTAAATAAAAPGSATQPVKRRLQLTFEDEQQIDCQQQDSSNYLQPKSAAVASSRLSRSDDDSNREAQRRPYFRTPNQLAGHQRLVGPRLSLLGKPIYLSSHKCHYRNTRSMRWKMRLRSFLEQPQGFFPWLYHFSL